MPNCFMVTLCPCVALAQLSTRLGVASYRLVLGLLLLVTALEITSFALVWTMSDDDDDSSDGSYYFYGWEHSGHSGNAVANGTFAVLTLLVQMLLFVYIWQLRVKTRTRFQLPGNAATDCLSSWFCSCCTVAQLRTHLRCYQPGDCSFGAPTCSRRTRASRTPCKPNHWDAPSLLCALAYPPTVHLSAVARNISPRNPNPKTSFETWSRIDIPCRIPVKLFENLVFLASRPLSAAGSRLTSSPLCDLQSRPRVRRWQTSRSPADAGDVRLPDGVRDARGDGGVRGTCWRKSRSHSSGWRQ